MCIRAVHERVGGYGSAILRDGAGVEGTWGVQVGTWGRDRGGRDGCGCRGIRECLFRGLPSLLCGIYHKLIWTHQMSYDANMQELQSHIQEHLSTLLIDPSSTVKRAVLHDISSLCIFLGRQKTNDVLLSHMITYLNDRDWLLRYAFFESVVDVAACAGGRSLEEYILPLMVQALSGRFSFLLLRVLLILALC